MTIDPRETSSASPINLQRMRDASATLLETLAALQECDTPDSEAWRDACAGLMMTLGHVAAVLTDSELPEEQRMSLDDYQPGVTHDTMLATARAHVDSLTL